MQLFTGLILAVRNLRAHRHVDDFDVAATVRWLMFASVLFGALDAAVAASTEPQVVGCNKVHASDHLGGC